MPAKREHPASSSNQKRTRFAASPPTSRPRTGSSSLEPDNDDPSNLLEEDLPQGSAMQKKRAKRQLKDAEGYNSDSSNDDEGVVLSRRADAKGEGPGEDEDVDMFGDDLEDKLDDKGKAADKGKGKGKEKEFMDLNDVEGQEFDKRRPGSAVDSDSDSEMGEEEKTKKQGLDGDFGVDITPFNMKSEMEEGRFTADGEGYVENAKDPNEKHDMWLEDVDKDEIKKARRAHREREKVEREREEKEFEEGGKKDREDDLLREAVGLMERGETVLEALQRLGKVEEDKRKEEGRAGKKKSWAERQKERKAAMALDQAEV